MCLQYQMAPATIDDLDEISELYDSLNDYLDGHVNYPGWKKGIYPAREDASTGIEAGELFMLKKDNKIVGSVILNHKQEAAYAQATWNVDAENKEVMVVRTLAVHPDFMKQGVAGRLLAFVKMYALSLGCKAIRLDVTVQNEPAIALYEKCGYTYVDTVDLGLPYAHLKWFKLYELGI